MLSCENDATDIHRSARSRVGASLRRLHRHLEETRTVDLRLTSEFEAWQEKWSSRREQIAQRLASIDTQLEQLVQDNRVKPFLSVLSE